MKCKILLIYIFIFVSTSVSGQQRPVISTYMFNGLVLNPAYAGSHHQISTSFLYRDQWVNMPGAPTTSVFTAHSAIDKKHIGVGLMVYNDKIGVHNETGAYASYAYRIKLRKQGDILSLGLQGGVLNRKSEFSGLNLHNKNDPNFSYDQIFSPNIGTGVYYYSNKVYLGASVPFILRNRFYSGIEDVGGKPGKEERHYYLTGGYIFPLNEHFKLKPSTLITLQENSPLRVDMNLNCIIKDIVSVGASYRSGDSFIFLTEMIFNDFRIGYAYDLVASGLNNFTRGSHEFMINYRFHLKGISSSIPCPSYF